MVTVNDQVIYAHNLERPSRVYLKGIVIEPGLALNETAALFYSSLNGKRTLAEVVELLAESYDAPLSQCLDDCVELAQELEIEKIILRVARTK